MQICRQRIHGGLYLQLKYANEDITHYFSFQLDGVRIGMQSSCTLAVVRNMDHAPPTQWRQKLNLCVYTFTYLGLR